jgi:NarL family two-component system response regulator LiaR
MGVAWDRRGGKVLDDVDTIRVMIVDDQRLFASMLARVVDAHPDMEVVGEAHDGEEAVALCLEEEPDVSLRVKILILTVHADDTHVFQGIKAGARGYILKDCTPEDLSRAIRAVHAGDTIMAPDVAQKMLSTFEGIRAEHRDIAPPLTDREFDIVRGFARGKNNKEIARDLGITEKTVRNHASNIYAKLHVFDRTQAVLYAIRKGLVDLEDLNSGPSRGRTA